MQANETDFGPHVKDIAEALENKLDEATIVEELRQYVENYGIDLATAKEAIVRKHYGDPRTLQASAFMPLADIKADESSISFRAKIVSVFSKKINLKDGSQKTIFEGQIADGSATLRFTVWRDEFTAEPGTILEVTNAYSKGWKDRVDLNLGDRCRVREVEDDPGGAGCAVGRQSDRRLRERRCGTTERHGLGHADRAHPGCAGARGDRARRAESALERNAGRRQR